MYLLILGLIILVFGIKSTPEPDAENLGFIEGAWQSLMATLDSGTMGGDEGWAFRVVRFIATLGGIFLISILMLEYAISQYYCLLYSWIRNHFVLFELFLIFNNILYL